MDYIKAAFDAFKRHPLQWFLLGLLFGAMSNLVVSAAVAVATAVFLHVFQANHLSRGTCDVAAGVRNVASKLTALEKC